MVPAGEHEQYRSIQKIEKSNDKSSVHMHHVRIVIYSHGGLKLWPHDKMFSLSI